MRKKIFSKEVVIGFVTLVSLVILYFGLNYLKGVRLFKPSNHYYVLMHNVSELQSSGPVYADGFKVGVVSRIDYRYDHANEAPVVVMISLDEKMKVPTGSHFELKVGLTSGASLHLVPNHNVNAYCQAGDTLEGYPAHGTMETISQDFIPQIETMLPKLDSILTGLQTIVNHPALTQSLDHIEATTANLQKTTVHLNSLLAGDIPVIVSNLKTMSSDFSVLSAKMKDIDLKPTLAKVDEAIQNINQMSLRLNDKDNSMGLLLNDRSLYNNLDAASKNASDLLKDIKDNPKRYVHFSIF